jgi:uncharacterized protein YecE (DUF72 family)
VIHGGRIRIGCSGWSYESWRDGVFYPEKCPASRWLRFYATRFDTVELNASFYRLPAAKSARRWADESPGDFCFAVKVSRYVTHVKRLSDAGRHLPLLLQRIEPLLEAGKVGPLLWQLPPTFTRNDDRLKTALAEFPRELRHAIEFRHASWFADDVFELLHAHDVALVVADGPAVRSFGYPEPTAGFTYVRFHRGARGLRGNYSSSELEEWAPRLRAWARHGDVYAYFNNDWEGFAPANAQALRRLVDEP